VTEQTWLVDGPKTIDLERVHALKVGLIGGHIDVIAHDEPGMRIEVHEVSGKDLKITVGAGAVEINHAQVGWENWLEVFSNFGRPALRATLSVMVPRDVHLKLGVVSASVLVSGVHDDANVSSVSGEILMDSTSGAIELNAVSGELIARGHTGDIAANNVSGSFTATGTLRSVHCNGVSGPVFLDIAGAPDEIQVNTVSGGVTARLEAVMPVHYTVSTLSGRLIIDGTDIPKVHGVRVGSVGEGPHHLAFSANSVSGDVSILHGTP
jgi:hypothetical protein